MLFAVSQQQQQLNSPVTVQVITRGALLHFKMGSEERARSLFEGCLRNYPARLDLWSQYLDQVGSVSALHHTQQKRLKLLSASSMWVSHRNPWPGLLSPEQVMQK